MVNLEQKALESKLAELKQSYQATLEVELGALYQAFSETIASQQGQPSSLRYTLENVHRRLHKIAGSAGTFGFQTVGLQVRALEVTLQSWLSASHVLPSSTMLNAFGQQLLELQSEVSPSAKSPPPYHCRRKRYFLRHHHLAC